MKKDEFENLVTTDKRDRKRVEENQRDKYLAFPIGKNTHLIQDWWSCEMAKPQLPTFISMAFDPNVWKD